jgi:hypothetical protein
MLFGQNYTITGKVVDSKDLSPLIGATAIVCPLSDTANKTGTAADTAGNFSIGNVTPGNYLLKIEYIGYKPIVQTIKLTGDISLGTIQMKGKGNVLNTVTVEGKQATATQSGDTTQFNADAYKTHPDATAEDLVTKMPGVTSDNTGVKVNGEAVQQVYVDGKPFFGNDPTLALKNLPAEVIDKIQVFDKLSDQAQFTGFDDGNSQKTMNIITRKNKSNGQFGKAFAGYGTDDRYLAGGNYNDFNGDTRWSLLGLFNNVNQQNFSSQDILGVTGGSGQNFNGRGSSGYSRGSSGYQGGGSGANNFLVGQQSGIATTNSLGLNYSDTWGKKIKITGSYFFNSTDTKNTTQLARNYFSDTLLYNENDNSETKNTNHRINLRLEYNIDSNNAIIFTPSVNIQENYATTSTADTQLHNQDISAFSRSNTIANNSGYNYSGNLLFQHKFHKKGRTVSINVATSSNNKTGDGTNTSHNQYTNTADSLDQHYTINTGGYTISTNVSYTEPVGKRSQLMFNYSPSYTNGTADKESYGLNSLTQAYTDLDTQLSNKYNNNYLTQRGGMSYRLGDKKINFMIGANAQYATLESDEYFPSHLILNKPFTSILPSAMFNYRFADGKNLRIMYRTNTSAPSVTQLQDVVDISNPLLLKTGNPNLRQDYQQTLIMRYGNTKSKSAHNFFVFIYANAISDYIANSTLLPARDSFYKGYKIPQGSQLTLPVNLNGYFNTRSFATYSLPLSFVKSNLNLNGGLSYTRTPGQVNNLTNYSNNYAPTAGFVISSNISENIDFTVSYSGNYNIVNNTIQTQLNNNYYSHTTSVKLNYIFLKNFVFNTTVAESYYAGYSNVPSENFTLWNAYLAYKLLKDHALEARVSVFDLLNQNKSISRTVTETYTENSTTSVLTQYFMFTLTYTLRKFKGAMPQENNQQDYRNRVRDFMNPNNR